jgi:hypothetical protein
MAAGAALPLSAGLALLLALELAVRPWPILELLTADSIPLAVLSRPPPIQDWLPVASFRVPPLTLA